MCVSLLCPGGNGKNSFGKNPKTDCLHPPCLLSSVSPPSSSATKTIADTHVFPKKDAEAAFPSFLNLPSCPPSIRIWEIVTLFSVVSDYPTHGTATYARTGKASTRKRGEERIMIPFPIHESRHTTYVRWLVHWEPR